LDRLRHQRGVGTPADHEERRDAATGASQVDQSPGSGKDNGEISLDHRGT
jgi:hypothetical protein